MKKDLQLIFSYKANFIGGFVEVFVMMSLFYIFATALTFRGLDVDAQERFMFFYVGILLMLFESTALWTPINAVKRDLNNGTLEYIYSNPSSRYAYFIGASIADAIRKLIYVTPLFVILVLWAQLSPVEILLGAVFIVISITILVSFGVLIASMAIMYKQTDSLTSILDTFINFFAGGYIPIMVFPKYLQYFAFLFPQAYLFDIMRYIAFKGNWATVFPIYVELILLPINFIFFFFFARFMLRRVEKYAKKSGLHII